MTDSELNGCYPTMSYFIIQGVNVGDFRDISIVFEFGHYGKKYHYVKCLEPWLRRIEVGAVYLVLDKVCSHSIQFKVET